MTAVSGNVGWPDLAMVHEIDGRFAIRELKRDGGKLTEMQDRWLRAMQKAGIDAKVWRPVDLRSGEIERFLARKV